MSSNEHPAESNYCPICKTLPLNTLEYGVECPPLEYHIRSDDIDINSDNDKQFDKCALYYSVTSLKRIWSGKAEFPAEHIPERWSRAYTCAGSNSVTVLTDPHAPLAKIQESNWFRAIPSDPLAPEVVTLWHDWLARCDEKHKGCHVDGIPLLPTRVLDVGQDSTSFVKLIETSAGHRGAYISLSHCWGKSNPFITTHKNLQEMLSSGFRIEEAPATFRDAIIVTRKLGIRYLWIDSLCIIQGDVKDWEIESSRMAAIYRDATLSLESGSTADIEGFLEPRPHSQATLHITSFLGNTVELYLQSRGASKTWQFPITEQPIDTRGWCLQEKYLSRRKLRFLKDKICWSCRDAEWQEAHRNNGFEMAGMGATEQTMNLLRGSTPRRHRTLNIITPYQGWYRMIREFTRRHLTFASDVFPALSGLASVVADHDKGRYCAGIWWEDVAFGLCWKKSSLIISKPNDISMAPSWSWASVIGPLEFIDEHEQYGRQNGKPSSIANFQDFHVQPHGVNEYGQLDTAWIKLEAPMMPLEMEEGNTFRIFGGENLWEEVDFSFDVDGDSSRGGLSIVLLLRRDDISKSNWPTPIKEPVDALLYGLIIRPALAISESPSIYILQGHSQAYERVGLVKILTSISNEVEFFRKTSVSITLI